MPYLEGMKLFLVLKYFTLLLTLENMICLQMTSFGDGLFVERDGIVIAFKYSVGLAFPN